MSVIKEYFGGSYKGAFSHPTRRGAADRQYAIGRIVQSLLVIGVMFCLYYAISAELGEDPIKFFEDTLACQMSASAIGGLALAYIIGGAQGTKEYEALEQSWADDDANQNDLNQAGEQARIAAEEEVRVGENPKQKAKRVKEAVSSARAARKRRQDDFKKYGRYGVPQWQHHSDDAATRSQQ